MKAGKSVTLVVSVAFALVLAGCGESRKEREAKEQKRLDLEQQAQKDIQRSNEAVNEVSKKLGRKPPAMDLGLPADQSNKPPADAQKKPEGEAAAGTQTVPATPAPTEPPKP